MPQLIMFVHNNVFLLKNKFALSDWRKDRSKITKTQKNTEKKTRKHIIMEIII